jgi:hypothetical protein
MIFLSSTIYANADISIGQQYFYSQTLAKTYFNQYNEKFESSTSYTELLTIRLYNRSYIQYSDNIYNNKQIYTSLNNGAWEYQISNTESFSSSIKERNLTWETDNFDFRFKFWDKPTWNPEWTESSFVNEYQNLNFYSAKNYYFDETEENVFDEISVYISLPNIVHKLDLSRFIENINQRIIDRVTGSIKSFESKIYYQSDESDYYSWLNKNLLRNVGYQLTLIDPEKGIVEFKPVVMGYYDFLKLQNHFNKTTNKWESYSPLFANFYHILSFNDQKGLFELINEYELFSLDPLNEIFYDISQYFSITELQNGISFEFTIPYEVQMFNHFFNPSKTDSGMYKYHEEIQYDNNGFLVRKIIEKTYDAGPLGKFIETSEYLSNSTEIQNKFSLEQLALPIVFGGSALIMFIVIIGLKNSNYKRLSISNSKKSLKEKRIFQNKEKNDKFIFSEKNLDTIEEILAENKGKK